MIEIFTVLISPKVGNMSVMNPFNPLFQYGSRLFCISMIALSLNLTQTKPGLAAQKIVADNSFLKISSPITDLHNHSQPQQLSSSLTSSKRALFVYPSPYTVLDVPNPLKRIRNIYPDLSIDLATTPLWQMLVDYQITMAQNQTQPYRACLFGDSISSALGNTLGDSIYNFAMGGLTSTSLLEQLERLNRNHVQCQNAIIVIGANDAIVRTMDDQFTNNITKAIALTRQMGAKQIVLLPAFYSTLAASKKPALAGPIPRVEALNHLMQKVAKNERVQFKTTELAPLYDGKALNKNLTYDGVHLNAAGRKIYKSILLGILEHLI